MTSSRNSFFAFQRNALEWMEFFIFFYFFFMGHCWILALLISIVYVWFIVLAQYVCHYPLEHHMSPELSQSLCSCECGHTILRPHIFACFFEPHIFCSILSNTLMWPILSCAFLMQFRDCSFLSVCDQYSYRIGMLLCSYSHVPTRVPACFM